MSWIINSSGAPVASLSALLLSTEVGDKAVGDSAKLPYHTPFSGLAD
ncbi:hypothetical protein [Microbulbifer sp. ZKSA002]